MKVDHYTKPTVDHTAITSDPKVIETCRRKAGIDISLFARADDAAVYEEYGPDEVDSEFHAPTVKMTTEADVKKAEREIQARVEAEAPPPPGEWNDTYMDDLEAGWAKERKDRADQVRLSTAVIPSSVSKAHASGSGSTSRKRGPAELIAGPSKKTKTKKAKTPKE